jgi:hypothetical protein
MTGSLQGWLLLLVGFVAANWPFFTERRLLVGPRRGAKPFAWRLLELLLLAGAVIALGMLIESRIGQRAPRHRTPSPAALCLMVTFAFPGFVWRHLRKHGGDV